MSCKVYIIECEGKCKIGLSEIPEDRLRDMQSGNPFRLTLKHAVEFHSRQAAYIVECKLHRKFADSRIRGEWFDIPVSKVVQAINNIDKNPFGSRANLLPVREYANIEGKFNVDNIQCIITRR